ncbi:MAG: tRNA threonylcarbamoyladenosine dehydratase [Lentisphaerae bacterium]|nr:tRNA threonylcarbamoyladenosine dehydratase [Lentisphaerota bacterium]
MNDYLERFSRTDLLFGSNASSALAGKRVLIVGVGGVGGHAAENIIRAGVGSADLLDGDTVDISNCNRQIIALNSTIGHPKARILAARCREINPYGTFNAIDSFLKTPADITALLQNHYDFVVDAIDDVPVKVELIKQLKSAGIPFVSAMGAGGKTDPSQVKLADLSKTCGCPLARVMRNKLKSAGIVKGILTVYSPELPRRTFADKKIGSISYMPAIFGCFCAAAAIEYLLKANSLSDR